MSLQSLTQDELDEALAALRKPSWRRVVDGVVWGGPHTRLPLHKFAAAPARRAICCGSIQTSAHSTEAQYGLRAWDHAWAFTHGRSSVNPSPAFFAHVMQQTAAAVGASAQHVGVGAYSEGIADDVNKAVWSALALERTRAVDDILEEHARFHFGGVAAAAGAAAALAALERSWRAPLSATRTWG